MPLLLFLLIVIVVAVVAGAAIFSLTLKLLWWALIGLIIGGLGRALVPGTRGTPISITILGGVAAAIVGGVIARALELGGFMEFLIAVILAGLVALFYYSSSQ
jgi:uncharacterized membrane protein YeaQ/YmgE (transglycosylase-associated protein family)